MIRLLLFILLFASIPTKNYERYEWKEDRKITWEDFKGKPDKLSSYAATINTGISKSYMLDENGFFIKSESEVKAYFYPTLSWYKPKMAFPSVLAHERTHFDITELHARILRKRIEEFDFTKDSRSEIKKMYNEVEGKRQEMQHAFDQETMNSRIHDAEEFWELKIAELLEEYEDWE
tara:strand:- start:383 stop:913 length:531 start_codon:yes stop_codon:yes gene_type:complete